MAESDLDYNMGSSVMEPDNPTKDVDMNNISLLRSHLKLLDEWIAKHNTFDVISSNSKLTAEQQVAVHQQVVVYLRLLREGVAKKVEKLKNG